jgi:FAD synthetase
MYCHRLIVKYYITSIVEKPAVEIYSQLANVVMYAPHARQRVQLRFILLTNTIYFCGVLALFCRWTQGFHVVTTSSKPIFSRSMMATTAEIENWRVLPIPNLDDTDIYHKDLSMRLQWSDAVFSDSLDLHEQLIQCTDSYVAGPIQAALTCLDHSFRLYGPESVLCSFNGGKDAVVILHLVRAAYAAYCNKQQGTHPVLQPRVVYFDHADEFPEIRLFLHEQIRQLDLDMICFEQGTKFQDGLRILVDNNYVTDANTDTRVSLPLAFVLGTRLTDPNAGGQQQFAPSSHYMPPFMRVNPVLDWTYGHVWHFLRLFHLPYCCLYDQGFTSLGTVKDTLPCPALTVVGSHNPSNTTSIPKFWPAYMLRDWDLERAGRVNKPRKASRGEPSAVQTTAPSLASSSIGQLSTLSAGRLRSPDVLTPLRGGNASGVVETTDSDAEDVSLSSSFIADSVMQKTAGVLIIGDEILKGFRSDTNTQVAATALRDHNVVLKCVVVVSDVLEDIVEEIRRMQAKVDVVITSGGVGGTHDDVTLESVAAALNCGMELHDEMAGLLLTKMNKANDTSPMSEAQLKMATLPTNAKLRYLSKDPNDWPILQCKNIFILPGIPEFFLKKIHNVAEYLSCQMERLPAYKVVLQVDENSIVPILNQVVDTHPNVVFGSYPFVSHPEYKTVITVEGRLAPSGSGGRRNSTICDPEMIDSIRATDADVQMALDDLITRLPEGSVLRVDVDDMRLFS